MNDGLISLGAAQQQLFDALFDDAEDALGRGDIQAARSFYARARVLLEAHLELDPDNHQVRHDLAVFHEREAEAEADLGSLTAALEAHERALRLWRQLAEARPDDPEEFVWWVGESLRRAAFIRGTGFDLAEHALQRARWRMKTEGEHDHCFAELAWAQGRLEDARHLLLQHGDSYEFLLALASVELDLDRRDDAARHFAAARKIVTNPMLRMDPNLRAYVGFVRLRLEPDEEAARAAGHQELRALLASAGPDRVLIARYRRWLGLPHVIDS